MNKIEISNTTFIVPIKLESDDRIRNAALSIGYLINNFDTNVIVKEVDYEKKFESTALEKIKSVSDQNSLNQITYIYQETNSPVFHRTKILNEMIDLCTTSVIVNCDVDIILPPDIIFKSVNKIINNELDVVYPYTDDMGQYMVYTNNDNVNNFINSKYSFDFIHENFELRKEKSYAGHVQFFNKNVYIEGGMENENFIDWGPEDQERIHRYRTLGYRVDRIWEGMVYHFEHHKSHNHGSSNSYFNKNLELWNMLSNMNKEELKQYYSNQEYLQKYKGIEC